MQELVTSVECCRQLVDQVFTFVLGEAAFRQISGDFCKPNQRSRFIMQRRDDDARPELRTVFADSPVLFFISSFAQGGFQPLLRMAGLPCFFGIEDREVFADALKTAWVNSANKRTQLSGGKKKAGASRSTARRRKKS